MGIDEIKNLDINQRLNLIDMIWQTLENQEKDIESPAWHKDILEKRLEKIEKLLISLMINQQKNMVYPKELLPI